MIEFLILGRGNDEEYIKNLLHLGKVSFPPRTKPNKKVNDLKWLCQIRFLSHSRPFDIKAEAALYK